MDVWKKQSTSWVVNGKRVAKGTPNATKVKVLSKRFYGSLRLANGKLKQAPLTDEKKTSTTLLRRLQTEQDERRANGVDRFHDERRRPLLELLDEYADYLKSKGNSPLHVSMQSARCRKLIAATKAKTIDDFDGSRILSALAVWRNRKSKPLNVQTSNHYLIALKGFSRWLWTERKASDDALAGLRRMNAETDRRRIRRALTTDEMTRLLLITQQSNKTYRGKDWHFRGVDRAMIYLTAAMTGLRCRELGSIRRSAFDFDAGTFTLVLSHSLIFG